MAETINTSTNETEYPSFHTHDEELRGVDLGREVAVVQFGQATVATLHAEYGELRDGADIVPASE
ncbi:hypothetical protein H7142_02805 [Candidatus Saccharibacteria bacterium]|nr:hypothetical protein [Candidatus Saccharibacteria bacterium]